jgi:hypothetical protein
MLSERQTGRCALVFPPLWYFPAVPADLTHTAGALVARGHTVQTIDLSARTHRTLVGERAAWRALRDPTTYPDTLLDACLAWWTSCRRIPTAARYRPRTLTLPRDGLGDVQDDVVRGRAAALDPDRNPAFGLLDRTARALAADAPDVVGLALVHPDQKPQVPALAALLRRHGYTGTVVIYGSLEDVLAPSDFAPDLVGLPEPHAIFEHVDAVITGEAESALAALLEGLTPVPNAIWPDATELPPRHVENLANAAAPDFSGIDPDDYPTPRPVVDLRLGRGCPWARCAFCAIQAHQSGYRAGPVERVVQAMEDAHARLGTTHFRIRDDLVTPVQLRALSEPLRERAGRWTWMARSRFEPGLSRAILQSARAAGLSELWMGLESGSERVRDFMDKGVRSDVIERILGDCAALGIRVRALCIVGFPTETDAEYAETEAFLRDNRDRLSGFALTPFQVMRSAPMLDDPGRYGLVERVDPLPRHRRLRHHVPVHPTLPTPAVIQARHERTLQEHADWAREQGGIGPTFAWLAATGPALWSERPSATRD